MAAEEALSKLSDYDFAHAFLEAHDAWSFDCFKWERELNLGINSFMTPFPGIAIWNWWERSGRNEFRDGKYIGTINAKHFS